MKIIAKRLMRGDYCTQPGGVILRQSEHSGEFVTHCFNRLYGSAEPTEFYWGHYFKDRYRAELDYEDRVGRAEQYDTGGSLIPVGDEDTELETERLRVLAGEKP